MTAISEVERIRDEYARRERTLPPDFYALTKPANLFAEQQKSRALLQALSREQLLPLAGRTILDVGCGDGRQLVEFEHWGARAEDLAGVELIESRQKRASARFADRGPDVRLGDASDLPWPDAAFDIVYQSTVFSSILDDTMRRAVAREIIRVLKPGGALIWYDFFLNNPANPSVRGVGRREIRALFPECRVRLQRVTLAPPIARRIVPITWLGSLILERLNVLNTHYLGLIQKLR